MREHDSFLRWEDCRQASLWCTSVVAVCTVEIEIEGVWMKKRDGHEERDK